MHFDTVIQDSPGIESSGLIEPEIKCANVPLGCTTVFTGLAHGYLFWDTQSKWEMGFNGGSPTYNHYVATSNCLCYSGR